MELAKVQKDYALIDRLRRIQNGANVHYINQLLQAYLGGIEMLDTARGLNDADWRSRLMSELDGVTQEIIAYISRHDLPVR